MEDGYYRACVAVMTLGEGRVRSKVHRSRNVSNGRERAQTSGRGSARMDRWRPWQGQTGIAHEFQSVV